MGGAVSFFESVGGGIVNAANTVANTAKDVANAAAGVATDAANRAAAAANEAANIASTVSSQTASIASNIAGEARNLSGQALDLANQAQQKAREAGEMAARAAQEESEALANQAKALADQAVSLANQARDVAGYALNKAREAAETAARSAIEQTAGRVLGMVIDGLGLSPSRCYSDADSRRIVMKAFDTIAYLDEIKAYKSKLQENYQAVAKRKQDAVDRKTQLQAAISQLISQKAQLESQVVNTREGITNYTVQIGPIPGVNNIDCLTPERLNDIVNYLKPYADQITGLTAETNALTADINARTNEITALVNELSALGKQQDDLTNQIRNLNVELLNNLARKEKLEQVKDSVDKGLCCMKDPRLENVTGDGVYEFIKPITPEQYCGEYWGRGGKCDQYHNNICLNNPTDTRCSCYSQVVMQGDTGIVGQIKNNPRCYSAECDKTKYLDSTLEYDAPCDTLASCSSDIPEGTKIKNIQVAECSMFSGMFLVLLVIIVVLAMTYSYAEDIDKEYPLADLSI